MQGPEGEGLLQGLRAGRTVLGGSGEVPMPPGHPFRFTHSRWDLLGGKGFAGPFTWNEPGCAGHPEVGDAGNSR